MIIVKDHEKRVIFLTSYMTFRLPFKRYFIQERSRHLCKFTFAGIGIYLQARMRISKDHLGYASSLAVTTQNRLCFAQGVADLVTNAMRWRADLGNQSVAGFDPTRVALIYVLR